MFYGTEIGKNGEKRQVLLRKASATPIRRHVKVRNRFNPYDPEWQAYRSQRDRKGTREYPSQGSKDNPAHEAWEPFRQAALKGIQERCSGEPRP